MQSYQDVPLLRKIRFSFSLRPRLKIDAPLREIPSFNFSLLLFLRPEIFLQKIQSARHLCLCKVRYQTVRVIHIEKNRQVSPEDVEYLITDVTEQPVRRPKRGEKILQREKKASYTED